MTNFELLLASRVQKRRAKVKQWVKDAVAYWEPEFDDSDIGCEWSEADVRCWRCGYLRTCQRCHIVPKSCGGLDDPSNVIPLCADCHDEMPNVTDKTVVWEWIRNDHGTTHDTYWTVRAIAIARQHGLTDDELMRFDAAKLSLLESNYSLHFGQLTGRARRTPATTAWLIKECCR